MCLPYQELSSSQNKNFFFLLSNGSQSVIPKPAASAPPDNLLEIQIIGITADLVDKNFEVAPSTLLLQASTLFWCSQKFENHCTGDISWGNSFLPLLGTKTYIDQ